MYYPKVFLFGKSGTTPLQCSPRREHMIIKGILKMTHKDKCKSMDWIRMKQSYRSMVSLKYRYLDCVSSCTKRHISSLSCSFMISLSFNSVENEAFVIHGSNTEEHHDQQVIHLIATCSADQRYIFQSENVLKELKHGPGFSAFDGGGQDVANRTRIWKECVVPRCGLSLFSMKTTKQTHFKWDTLINNKLF